MPRSGKCPWSHCLQFYEAIDSLIFCCVNIVWFHFDDDHHPYPLTKQKGFNYERLSRVGAKIELFLVGRACCWRHYTRAYQVLLLEEQSLFWEQKGWNCVIYLPIMEGVLSLCVSKSNSLLSCDVPTPSALLVIMVVLNSCFSSWVWGKNNAFGIIINDLFGMDMVLMEIKTMR